MFQNHGLTQWNLNTLEWSHNGRDSVSNHQPRDCLYNRLSRRISTKASKIRVTGLCAGNSPGTGEFPAQRASNAENVFIWWRHHEKYNNLQFIEVVCKLATFLSQCIYYRSREEPETFQVNTMSANAQTHGITKPLVAMVYAMWNRNILALPASESQQRVTCQYCSVYECKFISISLKSIRGYHQVLRCLTMNAYSLL